METLGRSGELEGTYNDTNKTSTVKSLNMTGEGGRPGKRNFVDDGQSRDSNTDEESHQNELRDKLNKGMNRGPRA